MGLFTDAKGVDPLVFWVIVLVAGVLLVIFSDAIIGYFLVGFCIGRLHSLI